MSATVDAPQAAGSGDAAALAAVLQPLVAGGGKLAVWPAGHRLPRRLDTAVALAPAGYAARGDDALRVIAAGFDGGRESVEAVGLAGGLALAYAATLRVYAFVGPAPPGFEDDDPGLRAAGMVSPRARIERGLDELSAALPPEARTLTQVIVGDAVAGLLARSAEVDLLVLGTHRRGRLDHALLGSVARSVGARAECPVVIVPAGTAAALADGLLGTG